MKMKGFGKCLKMDLQSVGGEVSAAYMTLLLFTLFGANPLLVPSRIYMADYSFAIPAAVIIFYCFFRIFKRLLYIAMFTDGAILYRTLPISEKSAAISKITAAGGTLTILQYILLAMQWYILHNRLTEFQSHEFQTRTSNEYNAFMDAMGGTILKTVASSFALAALIFAAIAVYQTARNKSGGGKFLAVLAIAGVSFAAAGVTEVITNVFDLGAGASGAIEAVIRTAIAIVCLKIVIKRVQAGAN